MLTISPKLSQDDNNFYVCDICNIKTRNKKDLIRHLTTKKHNYLTQITKLSQTKNYICLNCHKSYKSRTGLWLHKKKCNNDSVKEGTYNENAIIELIKQNKEFKDIITDQNNKILDIVKDGKNITNNNTLNNTTNNNFNLQIFLNEKCKDAMNIMDFVSSLKLKLSDLEAVGKLGYSEGISKILIRGLRELDVFKRPIHCSDLKRESMYVKDKDTWEKENEKREKMKQAINYIANENVKQIPNWISENPEANDYESKKHIEYVKMLGESMGGYDDDVIQKNYQKIIKNIAREVTIEKMKAENNCENLS